MNEQEGGETVRGLTGMPSVDLAILETRRAREALRDHFAGLALMGYTARPKGFMETVQGFDDVARNCYRAADAMLAARTAAHEARS